MKKYSISKGVTLSHGSVLALTKEQAEPRAHALRKIEDGVFEVLHPVQFKVGEVIGYEGDLPKSIATAVEESDVSETKPADTKKQAQAPAKAKAAPKAKAPKAPKASGAAAKPKEPVKEATATETKPAETPAAS